MNQWLYSTIHNSACKVIEEQTLWGKTICRVWLPNLNQVAQVAQSSLRALDDAYQPEVEAHRITYVAAAAKIAEVLRRSGASKAEHVLLAPMESNVIPLPHQVHALARAVTGDQVRFMLADEVGLGKTIEAGLIMRELKLRGLVRRILVVAPKSLATQWVSEMDIHFNEDFKLVLGEDIAMLKRLNESQGHYVSPWSTYDQVIVSLDSVKPLERRRGWTRERIDAYNRMRYEDLITAGWDLIVVDEAHRFGGNTDQVARHKLGKGLADAAPYLLLLSATPHQGKSDAFFRLMSLVDEKAFPDEDSVTKTRVAPYVIRTEKRNAIDAEGQPLFKPRKTQTAGIVWESRHAIQAELYHAVTDYVREGYNRAMLEKKHHVGFLMILMQRLVTSSTRAIRTTLGRRLTVLESGVLGTQNQINTLENLPEDEAELEAFYDMDGEELLDELLAEHLEAMENEVAHVQTLLALAERCEQTGVDAKAEALLEWIYQLETDESETDLKLLIFTEFVPTQRMLEEFLSTRGISVVTLNGSLDMDERKQVQVDFRHKARVLISTDAGGEGLNLQFCHVIINYDIPWNPMRLEQRIGRVDRIGQPKVVRAINFLFEDTVEYRVRQVLQEKLAIIFNEFGIDKTGDVLDSAQAGQIFDDVFTRAILNPEKVEKSVEHALAQIRQEATDVREQSVLVGISDEPDLDAARKLRAHPLPFWIERMTTSYLKSHGGATQKKHSWWELSWPGGNDYKKAVFTQYDADRLEDAELLNLATEQVRRLALNIPQFVVGQTIPEVVINGLPPAVKGVWGLFEINLHMGRRETGHLLRIPARRCCYRTVFIGQDGKLFIPTARHIWESLQSSEILVISNLDINESTDIYQKIHAAAEEISQEPFASLLEKHNQSLLRETERGEVSFAARRKAIGKLGLPEVRNYRLTQCEQEEEQWRKALQQANNVIPDFRPLLMFKI